MPHSFGSKKFRLPHIKGVKAEMFGLTKFDVACLKISSVRLALSCEFVYLRIKYIGNRGTQHKSRYLLPTYSKQKEQEPGHYSNHERK